MSSKQEFDPEEIANSNRIYKSATPKGTLDWYIKWISSVLVLAAITIRAADIPELVIWDLILSWLGAIGWCIVGFMWKDRAVLILNGVVGILLFSGILNRIY